MFRDRVEFFEFAKHCALVKLELADTEDLYIRNDAIILMTRSCSVYHTDYPELEVQVVYKGFTQTVDIKLVPTEESQV